MTVGELLNHSEPQFPQTLIILEAMERLSMTTYKIISVKSNV